MEEKFKEAADKIREAKALVISTGAGMGVDSGLPDFRGKDGFWRAYPLYKKLGINFMEAANPAHFSRDPSFGWGFYGHRVNLYRKTEPHRGYQIIKDWIEEKNLDNFVVTSNVDGHFQKASYPEDKVFEVHGSIHHLQCTVPCCDEIWENNEEFEIDTETMRSKNVPTCPRCGETARPNILMFGDFAWISSRTDEQERKFKSFLDKHKADKVVVMEIGAGTAVPTIRHLSERIARGYNATIARINPREYQVPSPHLSIPCGGLEATMGIDKYLNSENNS